MKKKPWISKVYDKILDEKQVAVDYYPAPASDKNETMKVNKTICVTQYLFQLNYITLNAYYQYLGIVILLFYNLLFLKVFRLYVIFYSLFLILLSMFKTLIIPIN